MDHMKVLKRAFEITWRYRVLWVFGIILALTTGGNTGSNSGAQPGSGGTGGFPPSWDITPGDLGIPGITTWSQVANIAIGIGAACCLLLIALVVITIIARYVAETSLIRLVDDHEETNEKRSVREGFRLGWSNRAFRLFLINLVVDIPIVLGFILLFALVAAPLLLWTTESVGWGITGTVFTIGLGFLAVIAAIVVGTAVTLLKHFFQRVCVLEDKGVGDSIREGYAMVRRHLIDVGLMWLIMVGLGIGFVIVMIPIMFLLLGVGLILGGLPALLVKAITGLFMSETASWITAAVVGTPFFFLTVIGGGAFIGGLIEVFKSSTWTLTYRELRAMDSIALEEAPIIEDLSEDPQFD
jgi:hypothetical protein